MKSEQELRDYRIELRVELNDHILFPQAQIGIQAAINTIDWVLGDTPYSDLARVKAILAETHDEIGGELWMFQANDQLWGITPIQCIAGGRADEVIASLRKAAA